VDKLRETALLNLLLFLELLFNRTLGRIAIFIPVNQFTYYLFILIQKIGFLLLLILFSISFLLIGRNRDWMSAIIATSFFVVDLLLFRIMPLLLLYAALRKRRGLGFYICIYYFIYVYMKSILNLDLIFELIWILLPLLYLDKSRIRIAALYSLVSSSILLFPYYAGMILRFGMGLVYTALLPFAVFSYSSSRDELRYIPLFIGPYPQLSVHILYLSSVHLTKS